MFIPSWKYFRYSLYIIISFCIIVVVYITVNPLWYFPTLTLLAIRADENALYNHVKYLSTIKPARNFRNTESLDKAASYIKTSFDSYCDAASYQTFNVEKVSYKNVICDFGTGTGEVIVIGAHYDAFGEMSAADDNASGVAGLLETARLIKQLGIQKRIQLVAYTLEEPPYFRTEDMGSYHHAKNLYDQKIPIKFTLILECIGYFTDVPWSQKMPIPLLYLVYPNVGNFITLVGNLENLSLTRQIKSAMLASGDIPVYSINSIASLPGIDFSDHLNYWTFGIPAFMITDSAPYRNPYYHDEKDTIETLNFHKMAETVNGVIGIIQKLK